MIKRIKNWFIKIRSKLFPAKFLPLGVNLAYEAHGHKFYTFESVLYASVRRQKRFQVSLSSYEKNVKTIDQIDHAKLNATLINQGDLDALRKVNDLYTSLIELDTTTSATMAIAMPIILIDDEPFNRETFLNSSPSHERIKSELCERHEDIEDFFLKTGIEYIKLTYQQLKDIEILDYLKKPENRIRERLFFNQIGKNIWGRSLVK